MKMVELLIGYDMEKVYSGEVPMSGTDMVTDIHISSDDELTPSERRQFETELSQLIRKHFVTNERRLEQELLKRQYNVKDLLIFYVDYAECGREEEFYSGISGGVEEFIAKLKSGEIEKLSRSFILATGVFSEHLLEQFDRHHKTVIAKISVQEESVSTSAIRHVLSNIVGLTEPEYLLMFGRFGGYSMGRGVILNHNYLVPLSEVEHKLKYLNYPYHELIAAMVKYTKDHPIEEQQL